MREHARWQESPAQCPSPEKGSERLVAAHPDGGGIGSVEVVVVPGAGGPRLELRLLAWGPGIGWYPLRRIVMDGRQARELRRSLAVAERYLHPRPPDADEPGCRIIPFSGAFGPTDQDP